MSVSGPTFDSIATTLGLDTLPIGRIALQHAPTEEHLKVALKRIAFFQGIKLDTRNVSPTLLAERNAFFEAAPQEAAGSQHVKRLKLTVDHSLTRAEVLAQISAKRTKKHKAAP